jgi:coiled-coil domain-containing protein 77
VYLPNEQVDSLLLTIESLRAQLQQQERLSRERISALLEDRRLRMAEERARRAAETERLQEGEKALARSQEMLLAYTRDFLRLKHSSLQAERSYTEHHRAVQLENEGLLSQMEELRRNASLEVHTATSTAKMSSEQYVALYRQQVSDTERTMGLLKDQHNGLQQALAMRVKELEAVVGRLKQQYRSLDERRGLEVEGFASEVALLQKQVQRLELKAYGRKTEVPQPETGAAEGTAAMVSKGAKAIRAMKARVAQLERVMQLEAQVA